MTIQSNNNNLNYLIDTTSTKFSRLFVLSFQRIEENNVKKDHIGSFSRYYIPNIEIKNFNVLIDGKSFFDLPVKNEEEACEKIIEMSRNYDHITVNLFDFAYFKKNYKLIATDLIKQIKLKHHQQINFIGKLEQQNNGAAMFFIIKKSEESTFELLQNSVIIILKSKHKRLQI